MAMEQLEIHSRSYLVRYITVPGEHTISWSLQPHKKSLNFGIFRRIKASHDVNTGQTQVSLQSTAPSTSQVSSSSTIPTTEDGKRPRTTRAKSIGSETMDKLHAAGLQDAYWHGRVEPEKVTTGKFDIPKDQGGVWALVFDNTFSKQVSKTATLVLLTYPTGTPAPASHHLKHFDTSPSISSITSPRVGDGSASISESVEHEELACISSTAGFHTGILKKRKRKRHQGFARRFFSLDYTTSTLSYYLNRESSALRGAVPLALAAITASERNYEIWVDSGAEVWHLRANNQPEWDAWRKALERAAQTASKAAHDVTDPKFGEEGDVPNMHAYQSAEDEGWRNVETIVGRVSGIRDAARRLCSNTKPVDLGLGITSTATFSPPGGLSPIPGSDRPRPFWRRKTSAGDPPGSSKEKSITAGVGMVAASTMAATPMPARAMANGAYSNLTPHLNALLADLDAVVNDFSTLITEAKSRRWLKQRQMEANTVPHSAVSRRSIDSTASEEFFDADDSMFRNTSDAARVVLVENDSSSNEESFTTDDDGATSDSDNDTDFQRTSPQFSKDALAVTDLSPLPLDPVNRRNMVKGSTILPPSLIGLIRKNVGKDMSTVAMPVSANEPLNILQKIAEQLEYSELLDEATNVPLEGGERLLYVTAFALSNFSNARAKERAIRKPFNPLLGETYELVREDKGFRFLAEKVCHRPLVMASHADSANWTFTQSPMPTQKFWGKSAELNTSGRVRISLHATNDTFSYTSATSFLRNIIAGEKYVEPVGTMTVHHENSGDRAVITFKAKGMFSGRSEDVSVQVLDSAGNVKPLSLHGKWTSSLALFDKHESMLKEIWQVGPLLDNPAVKYGFTTFAATLNEITPIELNHAAPTDTRLRPDQRLCEDGQLDLAEEVKLDLEERQRQRRKDEDQHKPRWFSKVKEYADEEVWKIKSGKEGYWERRRKGEWPVDLLDLYSRSSSDAQPNGSAST